MVYDTSRRPDRSHGQHERGKSHVHDMIVGWCRRELVQMKCYPFTRMYNVSGFIYTSYGKNTSR